ncbi:oligoendopeptidase F [Longibacter salinarum]|uniref:Oligoendopeptidase F n=1 Tax=Longibacter salinarum TaxID=1850348 RepID=A0A2A8D3L1_9BACT|nr:oligoendopeptidase F [Longibacter salinarum]
MEATQTGAESVNWSLTDLHDDSASLEASLSDAQQRSQQFAETYRGRIEELEADELAEALVELEEIQDDLGRAYAYAYLAWSTNTSDEKHGAQLQKVKEAYNYARQNLLFIEVEWANVEDERAAELLEEEALEPYRHYLEVEQENKKHVLTEPEEKVLSEKQVTGQGAWTRYFDETMGAARYELNGETITQQEILSKLYEPDRDLRKNAALSFTEGLTEEKRTLTYIFNTLLAEKASNDRLRGYDHWMQSRNVSNEVEDETVEALIHAVTSRYDLVARFYKLKKRLLGLDELHDYDRYAPIGEADTRYDWDQARGIVLDAYGDFHPVMSETATRFFEEDWIDAAVKQGKRSGAFSHGTVPSAHPYVLMNYTGRSRDVQTLAHELGHGIHQFLSREQTIFHHGTPLTTAETASVFGEMLVFQRLMSREDDPKNQLAMLISKIDDTIATVFRQIAMNRFEDRIHTERREKGEIPAARFNELWMETQEAMFEGSVALGDHYRHWWSYIPHFLHTPGYVYAYAFGELLVLALYSRYQESGDGFAERYIDLLSAGGSDWPHRLVEPLGVDLTDLDFWHHGLDEIESLIDRAETLAEATETA